MTFHTFDSPAGKRGKWMTRFMGLFILISLTSLVPSRTFGKPLKVFILVGQSNMEGHAQTRTFPAIAKDPKTSDIYKAMVDADGKPVVCDNVWIAYTYGNFSGDQVGTKSGKLTAGWGSQHHVGTGKIGPEFTFGIYMNKLLDEPILLIKTAWGGKSLQTDFRPPSGGPYVWLDPAKVSDEKKAAKKEATGKNYNLMIDYVREVLADPGKVCPAYDPKEGYELAGFVWFQGFNDYVGSYPQVDPKKGRRSPKDYSEYSHLLECFIRDVRKDLKAPELPFVIGVLGTGGKTTNENTIAFRNAMAAPAKTDEFKATVANVFTETYWPTEIDAVQAKIKDIKDDQRKKEQALKKKNLSPKDFRQARDTLNAEAQDKIKQALTKEELFLLNNGISNQGFHYYGSAKFFGQIGKAFAEALVNLRTN